MGAGFVMSHTAELDELRQELKDRQAALAKLERKIRDRNQHRLGVAAALCRTALGLVRHSTPELIKREAAS